VARADSTIRVNIIGDAKSLGDASRDAEKSVGGIGKAAKVAGGLIAGAFAADAVLDFAQTALRESDRVGDATTRLEEQLGGLAAPLIANAEHFAELGASAQDMLELEARLADLGTAAGIADAKLAPMAQSVAEGASALALLGDTDAATFVDLIGKAAGGASKPLKELGISLTDAEVEARALADTGKDNADALTDGELAAARLTLIMEKLAPRIAAVTEGEADLEQKQSELQAKFETLTGKIGAALEGPLTDFLTWVLSGIEGLGLLGQQTLALGVFADTVLAPLGRLADALRTVVDIASNAIGLLNQLGAASAPRGMSQAQRSGSGGGGPGGSGVTVQVQGGSPEVIEQAVRDAVATINGRNGRP